MNKNIRFILVLIATLTLFVLASNPVAWAHFSSQPTDLATGWQNPQPEWDPDQGSVRPPNCSGLTITASGIYSVCGMAVIDVKFKTNEDIELLASIDTVIPVIVGDVTTGSVAIGCLVNGVSDTGPHDHHADIKICFAAPPKSELVIKFYDETTKTWTPLETTMKDGMACAIVNYSGKYVLVKR